MLGPGQLPVTWLGVFFRHEATTPWKIHAGHSAPFWACKRESRWLQIQFGSSHDEASWSGDISYDTSASGVYALAVGHGEDNSDSSSTTSTSSSISTVTNRTLFSVDETTDKFVKVRVCINRRSVMHVPRERNNCQ